MWKILREEIRKTASRKIIWCGIVLVLAFVTFRMGIVLKDRPVVPELFLCFIIPEPGAFSSMPLISIPGP